MPDVLEPHRRRVDEPVAQRLTALEVEMLALGRRLDEHLRQSERTSTDTLRLIEKMDDRLDMLDARQDKQDLRWAQLIVILSLVVMLANIVGPVIAQRYLGA